ncbi:MAG: sugar ABC transporter ATP-binding protein [Alphaproteobacteria bacterium]
MTQIEEPYIIRAKNITKTFAGVKALSDVEFKLCKGEVHCIAGENGCGKSTLIKIISGVYTPDSGAEIELFGKKYKQITPKLARLLGIHVIWQDLAIFPYLSVAENIAFDENLGNPLLLVSKKKLYQKSKQILDDLGFDLPMDAEVGDLSIAQRQIIAICRALTSDVKVLFMDEPTASLTYEEAERLFKIVRKLTKQGIGVVFVSHRTSEVLEISDQFTVIRNGELQGQWAAQDIDGPKLVELMTGIELNSKVMGKDCLNMPTLMNIKNLSRHGEYNDINLNIKKGEIIGLSGRLGAGRTELALSLFGMSKPLKGTITLNGTPYIITSNKNAIEHGIAYVSEDRLTLGLIQEQSIERNTNLTILDKMKNRFGFVYEKERRENAQGWIKKLNVKAEDIDNPINTLSGGNQQKIVLAKWLATEPQLLILDSPTVGVDVGAREGIFKIVRELAEKGISILLISDEVSEIYQNSDRIYHMQNGKIIGEYIPQDISLSQLEEKVYG